MSTTSFASRFVKAVAQKIFAGFLIFALFFSSVPATAYAAIFAPGATLDPNCLPTDVNCDVITSALVGRLSEALTGTVGITPGLSTVTGSSTAFTTELSAGDAIKIGSNIFTVGSISSNTSLTLGSAVSTSTATTTGATAYRDPATLFSVATGASSNVFTVSKAGLLALINALTISSSTPSTTANALYNQGGTLYWNGIAVSSASSTVVTTATSTGITTSQGLLFADASGNLVADEGISYNPSTNKLTLTGGLDPLWLQAKDISGGNAAYYEWYAGQSSATSTASTGRMIYDSTDNRLKVSQNGSAYTALQTALSGTAGQILAFDSTGATATSTLFISGGNIGIGTTTPSSKLAVVGGFNVSAVTGGTPTNPNLISTGATTVDTTTVAGQTIITYASTTATKQFKAPTGVTSVRTFVVAGGGAGGGATGGGGGAGGMRDVASVTVSDATTYTITVGAGGTGGAGVGGNGSASSFGALTTTVGGGGGASIGAAGNGGSGGGGSGSAGAVGGTGTSGEGNAGGTAGTWITPFYRSGGGGGAGSVGSTTSSTLLGHGGLATSSNITGSSVVYAGGGGGGTFGETGSNFGIGGSGVGGNGSINGNGVAGTANKGGGGGGAGNNAGSGGAGGSGVVIVRFATVSVASPSNEALLRVTNIGGSSSSTLAFFETGASQSCIIAGQTGLSCSSDKNLKKDIEATESVLGNVLALKPVTYNWRTAEELGVDGFDPYATAEGVTGDNVGFVAQDVEKIFPGLVRLDPNGNRTLAYDKFAPIIVAALQEQYGGMMGVNIASVGDMAELFSSTTTLATLDDENYEYSSIVSNPISYISERVEAGIKIARTMVAEKMIAVEASFKRIFANELCLTDASGQLVCVTGENLKQIGGQTRALTPIETASAGEQVAPATVEATVTPTETAPADTVTVAVEEPVQVVEPIVEPTPVVSEILPEPTVVSDSPTVTQMEETVPVAEPIAELVVAEPIVVAVEPAAEPVLVAEPVVAVPTDTTVTITP